MTDVNENIDSPFWRIRYRPVSFQEIKPYIPTIAGQINGFLNSKNIPHLLLVGPTGSGKTILAEIIARELLTNEFSMNYKLLFADDPIGTEERKTAKKSGHISTKRIGSSAGITKRYRVFIQSRVRPFVSTKKFGVAPFKILSVKNFHNLSVEQQGFRRLMEQYTTNCRMILITDRISGIIDPILSRCQVVFVPFMPKPRFTKFLKTICEREHVPINLDIIESIREKSHNNVGKALDLIQLTQLRYETVTLETVAKMFHAIDTKTITMLYQLTFQGSMAGLRKKLREIFTSQALSKDRILLELSKVITRQPLERSLKAFYLDLIAQTDFDSLHANDDEIQLEHLLAQMVAIGKKA